MPAVPTASAPSASVRRLENSCARPLIARAYPRRAAPNSGGTRAGLDDDYVPAAPGTLADHAPDEAVATRQSPVTNVIPMLLLSRLLRTYLLRQLLSGGRRRRRRPRRPAAYGRYGRPRRRGGLFPFPHYSTRTRGGTRVTIGGCCLPLALTFAAGIGATVGAVGRLLFARR
jgi:hypothetical protein